MIRRLIREMIISEGALTPRDLVDYGYHIEIRQGKALSRVEIISAGIRKGFLTFSEQHDFDGNCLGSNVINSVEAPHGFGPLLYDITMELSGKKGLTPDRRAVSKDALKVWNFYLNSRDDVSSEQLDDLFGSITPENDADDCRQSSAYNSWDITNFANSPEFADAEYSSEYEDGQAPPDEWSVGEEGDLRLRHLRGRYMSFLRSPLSKVYYKRGTPTIDALEELGILIYR
jgi:hypothetical protein